MVDEKLPDLCRAVCGPLSRAELSTHFPAFYQALVAKAGRGGRVDSSFRRGEESLMDFATLKSQFDHSAELREVCARVMAERHAWNGAYSVLPTPERSLSAARYALLRGEGADFANMYEAYKHSCLGGMHPDASLAEFWDRVLGPMWEGVEYLPPGNARDELLAMRAERFMLTPPPPGASPVCTVGLPYLQSLGYSLLRAESAMLLNAPATQLTRREEELRAACRELRRGKWDAAYRSFRRTLGDRVMLPEEVRAIRGVSVLVLACIVAIHVGAPERLVACWVRSARELMIRAQSTVDDAGARDLAHFFDALLMWDALANRGLVLIEIPQNLSALACVPFAMGARRIFSSIAGQITLSRLVESTLQLAAQGQRLLASYAASALVGMPELGEVDQAALRQLLAVDFMPLFPPSTKADSGLNQVSLLMQEMSAPQAGSVYWDIFADAGGYIKRLEARHVRDNVQAAGTKIELSEVLNAFSHSGHDARDAAVVGLLSTLPKANCRSVPMYAAVLEGHPRLRLALRSGGRRLVRVVSRRPVLNVGCGETGLNLYLDKKQFTRIVRGEGHEVSLPYFRPAMQRMVDYLSSGVISIDWRSHEEEVRWLLAQLELSFSLQGEVPAHLRNVRRSDGSLVVRTSPSGQGYRLSILIQHSPQVEVYSEPGQGESVMLLTMADERCCCVQRNIEAEICAAKSLLQSCPTLAEAKEEGRFTRYIASKGELLSALLDLQRSCVPVIWRSFLSDESMVVDDATHAPLEITVPEVGRDWLEIGADLTVNEDLVLSIGQLLEGLEHQEGGFLPLEGGKRYVYLPQPLRNRLYTMGGILRQEHRKYLLPLAAIPAFVSQWEARNLPRPLLERYDMLHECDAIPVPRGLKATLREYQAAGFRWLLARARAGLGACLADDMGLGKTLQVLALLLEQAYAGPSLVVVPLSLCSNWITEAERFAPELKMLSYTPARRGSGKRPALGPGEVLVVSYGQMVANDAYFTEQEWNLIVLDEAQAIKNPDSRRARTACKLRGAARVCLSGTPVENCLVDLWSIMHFLNPSLLGPKSSYVNAGHQAVDRLKRLVAPLILRRTKAEVLPQLPPITEVMIGVEFSPDERALYESCRRLAVARARNCGSPVTLLTELTRLRRICCHAALIQSSYSGSSSKMTAMLDLVKNLRKAGHKALVFSQFTDVLDLAQQALEGAGLSLLRLDGSTPASKRSELVNLFQSGSAQAFLISLKAGGFGLNLTAADYVILLDPWWNPAVEDQAAGRSHRIGQHNPVTVCRLIVRDTVEERVMQMHDAKRMLAESVVSEGAMPLEMLREVLLQS